MSSFPSVCHHLAHTSPLPYIAMAPLRPAAFAHETLELILSFCDVPTLAVVGQVNSACLELSAPSLYEHIEITDKKTCELLFCESKVGAYQPLDLLACSCWVCADLAVGCRT